MGTAKTVVLTLATLGLVAAAGAVAIIYGGLYNVAATEQHLQPVFAALETAMRQSVRLRARHIQPPPLDDPALVLRGAACYSAKCAQCHGGPGVAQEDIGKSMQPLPGPLVDAQHHWRARELYWVTKHGIRMSGMPAWEFRLPEEDLWAVVAFLQKLPELTPAQYAALTSTRSPAAGEGAAAPRAWACSPRGASSPALRVDPRRGERALYQYACNACHSIPGITGSQPQVGPPLAGIARRTLIAGKLNNTQENMARWLRHTRDIDPLTGMPDMGVSEQDAADIAAYLATLD
ncbi:c-type cytochrome [Variovorax sp. J22R24]|uniref:c-type cytochrome n=1 Tax=Variovorax gracilis TaxID=3053502 RepID=UPI002577D24D|nr:c-type cytochrome [Variovorax sp. J22R24]MDM0108872.1 c-type cytochrome [Variovorax sp. J22R24]